MASENIDRNKSMLFTFFFSLCFLCNYKLIFIHQIGLTNSRYELKKNKYMNLYLTFKNI